MQFLITAYDGKDGDAYSRRMNVRPEHLENISKLNENGNVVCAGGITDGEGKLIGSALIMNFDSREKLEEYLANEPYVKANVWNEIKVETINVVIANGNK